MDFEPGVNRVPASSATQTPTPVPATRDNTSRVYASGNGGCWVGSGGAVKAKQP